MDENHDLIQSPEKDKAQRHASQDGKVFEEHYKALLESMPDSIVIVNATGMIVLVNSQTEKLFGYKREELLGQNVDILVPKRFAKNHTHHRNGYVTDPKVRGMGADLELY